MRFKNLKPSKSNDCLIFNNDAMTGSFELEATDELIEITNDIRKSKGYTDLVKANNNNDVYYNFHLIFDMNIDYISIQAVCNHGERDDYYEYEIPITQTEKELVFIKMTKWLLNIVYDSE